MKSSPKQFGIRTLLAITAGAAFLSLLLSWSGDWLSAVLISSWAVGTSVGIYLAARREKSTIAGSLIGGVIGTFSCYFIIQAILLKSRMFAAISILEIAIFAGFSMCGSAVLTIIIGVVRGGITWRDNQQEKDASLN